MKYDDAIMILDLKRNELLLSGSNKDFAEALGDGIAALMEAKTRALHLLEVAGGVTSEKA